MSYAAFEDKKSLSRFANIDKERLNQLIFGEKVFHIIHNCLIISLKKYRFLSAEIYLSLFIALLPTFGLEKILFYAV